MEEIILIGEKMKSSKYCKLDLSNNRVIKYQRKIGIVQEYYRSTTELNILEILNEYNVNIPQILEKKDDYFVEEYIDGVLLDSIYANNCNIDKSDIDSIISNIVLLTTINYQKLSNFKRWKNVIEFFDFQVTNTENIWNNYKTKYSNIYKVLNIDENIIKTLKQLPKQIDINRPLCLIHGDRHKNNMIKKNKKIYFIDWELSCIGDLAYDIAFHIHQMKYCNSDLNYFIEQLETRLPNQFRSAISDVITYMKFITARSVIYYVKIINDCSYSDELFEKFYFRLKTLSEYKEFGIELGNKDNLRNLLKKEKNVL